MNTMSPTIRGDGHTSQALPAAYSQPGNAELSASDAARLRQLFSRLRRRYPLGERHNAGNMATNRRDALVAASIMMADPGAFFDALAWSLDAQYGHAGREVSA